MTAPVCDAKGLDLVFEPRVFLSGGLRFSSDVGEQEGWE
jgi:hypothetical protein